MKNNKVYKNLKVDGLLMKYKFKTLILNKTPLGKKALNKRQKNIIKIGSLLLAVLVIGTVLVKNSNKEKAIVQSEYINEVDYNNTYLLYDDNNNFITIATYKEGINGLKNLVDIETGVKYYQSGYNPLNNRSNYDSKESLKEYLIDNNNYKSSITKEELVSLKEDLNNNQKEYAK